jgi:D-xylose transport system substrate-binding protein
VSVLKDATELGQAAGRAALELCEDPDIANVTDAVETETTGGLPGYAVLLDPLPITRDNLQAALDLDWLTEEELCQDVPSGTVDECP